MAEVFARSAQWEVRLAQASGCQGDVKNLSFLHCSGVEQSNGPATALVGAVLIGWGRRMEEDQPSTNAGPDSPRGHTHLQ